MTRVMFVGSFSRPRDGTMGGQNFACESLCASPISEHVEWIKIDSTQESLPPPNVARRAFKALRRVSRFIWYLMTKRPSAVLVFTSAGFSLLEKALMVGLARIGRNRVVWAPRSGHIERNVSRSWVMRRLVQFAVHSSDVVMCQSQSWKVFYQELSGLPDERFSVVPNWIDSTPYLALPQRRPTAYVNVLFLGWIETAKGIYDIVDAAQQNREGWKNLRFTLCGHGGEYYTLGERLRALRLDDQFALPGWVVGSEKLRLLAEADIFLMPSHSEGMPNALLEAMAAAKAIIASNVGGIPALVPDPTVGWLFQPRDVRSLGQLVSDLAADSALRTTMGARARAHVLARHDVRSVWPAVMACLKAT